MAEPAKIFNNVILGQFVLTGVPVKVYASGRFLTLTSTDDIEDPTIGFGMDEDGAMIQFSYPEVEFIQVHGNKVDIMAYNKGMAALHGGKEVPADAETTEEEPKKEESIMKLKSLIEISKDEFKAQTDAFKAELEAGKAKMKAAKEKMSDLKKQPIEDGMIPEAAYIDIAHAVKTIDNFNKDHHVTGPVEEEDLKELAYDVLKHIGFKPTNDNIDAAVEHFQLSKQGQRIPADVTVVKELYPLMEASLTELGPGELQVNPFDEPEGKDPHHEELVDIVRGMAINAYAALAAEIPLSDPEDANEMMEWIYSLSDGEAMGMVRRIKAGDFGLYESHARNYTFGTGDVIQNTNPNCIHFGSKGIVISQNGDMIRYTVTNGGEQDTYRPGDILTKSADQLESYK